MTDRPSQESSIPNRFDQKRPDRPDLPPNPSFNPAHILTHTPLPVLVACADRSVQFVNNRWVKLTGYEVSDIRGRPMSDFWDIPKQEAQQIFGQLRLRGIWE